ncbi:UNVERIFIED_ORG: hypothetical protein FHR35_009174 [Microbispora rosea subsp. rosea]
MQLGLFEEEMPTQAPALVKAPPMTGEQIEEWFWGAGGHLHRTTYPEARFVVNGTAYVLASEDAEVVKHMSRRRPWQVEFFDGRTVTTLNPHKQGVVPAQFRDLYPDNARFVTEGTCA